MRHFHKLALLTPFGLVAALAGVVAAFCGDDAKPADKPPIKLPGLAARGVVCDDAFYTVGDGKLTAVDLNKRNAGELSECYARYPKLQPFLDVADGKACVASADQILVADLGDGKILHSVKYTGEVHGLGFVGGDRIFVLGRTDVVVIDAASGETVSCIPLVKENESVLRERSSAVSAYQKVGNILYIADVNRTDVRIVNLDAGKVLDALQGGYNWYTGMQIVGDRAFVRTVNLSYGINNPQIGYFDLKTKKYTALEHPGDQRFPHIQEKDFDDVTLVAGPDGGVCLSWKGRVYQYDGEGRQVGATPLTKDDDGRLVGVWKGQALTAGKDGLRLTPLAKATTAKSD
jgi:hypothetical protein